LPDGRDAAPIAQAALRHHVVLASGDVFSVSRTAPDFMRFNVTEMGGRRVDDVLKTLLGGDVDRARDQVASITMPSKAASTPGGSSAVTVAKSRSLWRLVKIARRGLKRAIAESASDSEKWLGCGA
jgi:hypothetical protein